MRANPWRSEAGHRQTWKWLHPSTEIPLILTPGVSTTHRWASNETMQTLAHKREDTPCWRDKVTSSWCLFLCRKKKLPTSFISSGLNLNFSKQRLCKFSPIKFNNSPGIIWEEPGQSSSCGCWRLRYPVRGLRFVSSRQRCRTEGHSVPGKAPSIKRTCYRNMLHMRFRIDFKVPL